MKFYKAANQSRLLLEYFLFQKWLGMEFRGFFSSKNGSEQNSEVFLIQKWFGGMEFWWFFSFEKWFITEFWEFFSSEKWFGTEFRGFSLPLNRRNSDGTAVSFVLFRIPRNKFFCRKMATLSVTTAVTATSREKWPNYIYPKGRKFRQMFAKSAGPGNKDFNPDSKAW